MFDYDTSLDEIRKKTREIPFGVIVRLSGVSPSTLHRFRHGLYDPRPETIRKICDFLEMYGHRSEDLDNFRSVRSESVYSSRHRTTLRSCIECNWIFKSFDGDMSCPKCGSGTVSAKSLYLKRTLDRLRDQPIWRRKKIAEAIEKIDAEIAAGYAEYREKLEADETKGKGLSRTKKPKPHEAASESRG